MIHYDSVNIEISCDCTVILGVVEIEKGEGCVTELLEKEFEIFPCNHDHDCCGCAHKVYITNINQVKKNIYSFVIKTLFNV